MMTSRRQSRIPPPARDTDASPFAAILADVVARVPGAEAAVLVDQEGEAVDYTGPFDPFDLKVAGAHWRVVYELLRASTAPVSGAVRSLAVRGSKRSFLLHVMREEYLLVIRLTRRAGFVPVDRALSACEQALAAEARWPRDPRPLVPAWFGVLVECDEKRRPARIDYGGLSEPVEVLGSLAGRTAGLRPRERGFRIRLASGPEITVVREANGCWYADESRRGDGQSGT